ncbi:MAG: hypothetical protein JW856_00650, partial [Dehalococcoidales bacterium]|nr:hypothetical protein [Dehalococcoidales bacterium]
PAYADPKQDVSETVVREGRVIAEKPKIVTPYYLNNLEGFSANARKYFDQLIKAYGRSIPGLLYSYRNEPKEMNIVSDNLRAVVEKLNDEISRRNEPLTAIIKGLDEMWDIALIRFILEMTQRSVDDNIRQLDARGLLAMDDKGIPADARVKIEELFGMVKRGDADPRVLKEELDRWNLFNEYEDRFLSLFRK